VLAFLHPRPTGFAMLTYEKSVVFLRNFSLGLANVLNGAWHEALEVLGTALTIGRERRLLIAEGGVLARMAAAHLGIGERGEALALAEEAIAVSRRRGTRLWEFWGLLTRVRVLRESTAPRRRERSRPRSPKPRPCLRCRARRVTSRSFASSARNWRG
jgi:hypothetical protein